MPLPTGIAPPAPSHRPGGRNKANSSVIRRRLRRGDPMTLFKEARDSYRSLSDHHYGKLDLDAIEQADFRDVSLLEMADVTTSTTGILNKLFGGRAVWSQLNVDSPAYGALPKVDPTTVRPYGWRAKTAFASSGKGGQSEGTVPTAVTSSYFEVSPTIKEHSTQMRVSGLQQDLVDIDDAYGAIADIEAELGVEHMKEHERAVTEDVDTLSGNNLESLDRVAFDFAGVADQSVTAGDEDIHGIDRSAQSWADAVTRYNGNVLRNLTLDLVDDSLREVRENGGDTTYYLTGWDTWKEVSALVGDQGRFDMNLVQLARGQVNEADVPEGMNISTFVNHYQGRPIVVSDQVQNDGAGSISRFYGFDISNPEGAPSPRMGVEVVMPTRTWVVGEKTGGAPQAIDFVGDSALATTRHELVCRFFKAQFGIRDLQAP